MVYCIHFYVLGIPCVFFSQSSLKHIANLAFSRNLAPQKKTVSFTPLSLLPQKKHEWMSLKKRNHLKKEMNSSEASILNGYWLVVVAAVDENLYGIISRLIRKQWGFKDSYWPQWNLTRVWFALLICIHLHSIILEMLLGIYQLWGRPCCPCFFMVSLGCSNDSIVFRNVWFPTKRFETPQSPPPKSTKNQNPNPPAETVEA